VTTRNIITCFFKGRTNKIPSETLTSPKRKLGTRQKDVFPLGLPITGFVTKKKRNEVILLQSDLK